jgi:hypothetical protein
MRGMRKKIRPTGRITGRRMVVLRTRLRGRVMEEEKVDTWREWYGY